MISVAIISDDFTGALDTGVQFAKAGMSVKILTLKELQKNGFTAQYMDVLVVDAETRHVSPQEAYRLTKNFLDRVLEVSIPYIYVKTDSGLRGNIGSILKAALDATDDHFVAFLPAFPDMNRITENGIHYIDKVPIHKSAFGRDPFEPVKSPYVKDLFKDCDVETEIIRIQKSYHTDFEKPTIGIFDVLSNEDFYRIGNHLKSHKQLRIVAGCAGFAAILPKLLNFVPHGVENYELKNPLLVVCGSLSPITRRQVEFAHGHGFMQFALTPEQLLKDDYFYSPEGIDWIETRKELFCGKVPIIIDTGISHPERMEKYDNECPEVKEINRKKVSMALGSLLRQLLVMGFCHERTLMVIGGDTLLGFIKQLSWQEIVPIAEIELGAVLTCIHAEGESIQVISKSGSFGGNDLLEKIASKTSV